ncbi:retrovirus-related pol polyprotein from transposon TNT 1-94 [Tanacetum coccineum]
MHSRFEMSLMEEMKFFLGLQIHQSPKSIFINQAKYALEILKKHNMDNCHSIGTPLATKPKLDVDLSGEPVDQSDYRSKIGSLMYLTSSRPDLVQAVCYCGRYQARPTQNHLNCNIPYFQDCTAMSSAEAEYVALSTSYAQVMWMRTQLKDYGSTTTKYRVLFDSSVSHSISMQPVTTSYEHSNIHTRYHFIGNRLGNINPMIQPESEDLPWIIQKLEIAESLEHPSNTNVFTMKMEILLEPASNKLLVVITGSYIQQPESVNDAYLEEQGDTNITIDSLDMSTHQETVDQDDDDLANERDLLSSLIEKLKCEINDKKNRNKFLESSNKDLVDKLKGIVSNVKIDCAKRQRWKLIVQKLKSFEALQQHAIDLELALQQCQEQIKNDKAFKENQSKVFLKEREQYFEIQDLKAQLQDKGIVIKVISTTNVSRPTGFKIDFVILDMVKDLRIPIILGRPLLATTHAEVDVLRKLVSLEVGNQKESHEEIDYRCSMLDQGESWEIKVAEKPNKEHNIDLSSVVKLKFNPDPRSQENVLHLAKTITMSNELDLLFSLMFDELFNGTTQVVSKSFAVNAADAPNRRQQQHTTPSTSTTAVANIPPLNIQITPETTSQALTIFTGHKFSPNKTSIVYEKTSPRSDLRRKPTGRIFKFVGLRWIPMGKILASCTSKDDSEPTHGSNVDIPNIYESKQTLDLNAGTSINVQKEQSFDLSVENQVVLKSSAVTTANASDKCQQQPDSTSSTSTLATTVTADGNFDM